MIDANKLIEEGLEKARKEAIIGLNGNGISVSVIASSLNISEEKVRDVLNEAEEKQ